MCACLFLIIIKSYFKVHEFQSFSELLIKKTKTQKNPPKKTPHHTTIVDFENKSCTARKAAKEITSLSLHCRIHSKGVQNINWTCSLWKQVILSTLQCMHGKNNIKRQWQISRGRFTSKVGNLRLYRVF